MTRTRLGPGIPPAVLLLALLPLAAPAQTAPDVLPPPTPVPMIDGPPAPPAPPPPAAETSGPGAAGPRLDPAAFPGLSVSPLFSPAVGHVPVRADYRAAWFPDEPVSGQPTSLGFVRQDFGLSFPLWQCDTDEWAATANARGELFHTHAILPDSLRPFPDDLWNIRLGTAYRHLFDNGWIAGGSVSFGSASDKPFHSIEELTAGVNAFLRLPSGEHNAWLFSLSYSPTSELPIPIPGVAYVWVPSDRLCTNLGLPFQVVYRPLDDLTLEFSYMLLTTVHARATYCFCRFLQAYGGYDWENESYFLADRLDERERFFSFDMKLSAGLRAILGPHASLDLSSGYVFDRYYFQGRTFNDNNHDRIDVGAGPFLALQLLSRW
jgi:hypothetical protein